MPIPLTEQKVIPNKQNNYNRQNPFSSQTTNYKSNPSSNQNSNNYRQNLSSNQNSNYRQNPSSYQNSNNYRQNPPSPVANQNQHLH